MGLNPIQVITSFNYGGESHTVKMRASPSEVKRLLGLDPNKHFPTEGMPLTTVQAANGEYQLYVTPAAEPVKRTRWNYRKGKMEEGTVKRSTHRVFTICTCGKHVPVGRLHQHICKGVK